MPKCSIGLSINEKSNRVATWCHRDLSRLETSIHLLQKKGNPYPVIQANIKFNLRARKNIRAYLSASRQNGGLWSGILDALSTLESNLEERKGKALIKKQSSSIIDIIEKEIICYGVKLDRPSDERMFLPYVSDEEKKSYIDGDCNICPYFK